MNTLQQSIDKWGHDFDNISSEVPLPKTIDIETNGSINLAELQTLAEINPLLKQRMIDLFLEGETLDLIDLLKTSIDCGDLEQICYAAHTIKSSSDILGAQSLAAILGEVEIKSLNHDLNGLDLLMEQIIILYQLAAQKLTRIRDQN